ncbi:hypothetical protein [Mahella sp.]|uniref:hypothetical protein n=1 Tax=Mahella sp. TaxID=2798721 RepID=UPI0025C209E0|nr:hypothetical protein [Mahella sp.]MBZ4666714.1 Uncharacterized protein [Mahella sp.]
MKKVISIMLVAVMMFTITSSVFAAEEPKAANKQGISSLSMYEQARLFAKERGIELLPFDEGSITSKFKEFATPYDGIDDKPDNKTKDSIEDNLIEPMGGATANSAQRIYVNTSISDSIATAGQIDWFVFKTSTGSGAYNIYSTGSTDTYGELYKKTLSGKYELISSNDDGGSGTNFRLEVGLNSNTDYYVKVRHYSSTRTGSYTLRVEENLDSYYSPSGGSWTWDIASPDPDGVYFNIDKIVYLTPEKAQGYYIMVSQDSIREVRGTIAHLTYSAAVTFVMNYYVIGVVAAEFIVDQIFGFAFPDLTEMELDAIANAGNMNSSGEFQTGIKITSLTSYTTNYVPVMMNTYESWNRSYIYGEERYRGSFDTSDFTPLWR